MSAQPWPTRLASLAIAFLATALPAQAQNPEQRYLADRDRYIATFKEAADAGKIDDAVNKAEEAARADLARQMQAIVGTLQMKGFAAQGKLNIETLFSDDVGFGSLDALQHASPDGKSQVLVTTVGLLDSWLEGHKTWWQTTENVPRQMNDALKTEAFYTQAFSADAAVSKYADVPVTKPAKTDFAYATLEARSQDMAPNVPVGLIITVVQAGKVYVVNAPLRPAVKPIKACDDVRKDFESKANAALEKYNASNPKDEALFDRYTKLQEEGTRAFLRCFAERAKGERFFAGVVKQTQALVDALPKP